MFYQMKSKYLEGITIQLPNSASTNGSLGSFTAKKNDFEIFMADASTTSSKKRARDEEEPTESKGGQEMHSLIALVPNHSRQDKLFQSQ